MLCFAKGKIINRYCLPKLVRLDGLSEFGTCVFVVNDDLSLLTQSQCALRGLFQSNPILFVATIQTLKFGHNIFAAEFFLRCLLVSLQRSSLYCRRRINSQLFQFPLRILTNLYNRLFYPRCRKWQLLFEVFILKFKLLSVSLLPFFDVIILHPKVFKCLQLL